MKIYVELARFGLIETQGIEGTEEDVRERLAHLGRRHTVVRVLDEQGRDVSDEYREETYS